MNLQMRILSVMALIMGAVFLFLGLQAKSRSKALERDGVSTQGVITKAETGTGSKGKKKYFLRITWGEGADRQVDQRFEVKKEFFLSKVEGDSVVKSPDVIIRHLPGNPKTAVIEGGSSSFAGMEYLGYVVLALGLWGIWRGFLIRRAPAATPA